MESLLDTNIIVRLIVNDTKHLVEDVIKILKNKQCNLHPVIIAEVIYVLTSVYEYPKSRLAPLIEFLESDYIILIDKSVVVLSLNIFLSENISYADSFILAYSRLKGLKLETFDKKLKKLSEGIDGK